MFPGRTCLKGFNQLEQNKKNTTAAAGSFPELDTLTTLETHGAIGVVNRRGGGAPAGDGAQGGVRKHGEAPGLVLDSPAR